MNLIVFTYFLNKIRAFFIIGTIVVTVANSLAHHAYSSSIWIQYSSFGGVATHSSWTGSSLRIFVEYLVQLAVAANALGTDDNRQVTIVTPPLPFPNPFSLNRVMDTQFGKMGTVIGFTSDKTIIGDITVIIYDMFGNQIMSKQYSKDNSLERAERSTENNYMFTELTINESMLNYTPPVGVYFYVVQAEGKRIGNGKMLIVP